MNNEDMEFSHEAMIDTAAVATYLKALADGFDAHTLRFSDKRGEIVLRPKGLVDFEVKATRDGDRVRLEIRFDWKEHEAGETGRNGALHIEAREKP
jgi:amphi-Trp domain-containing protein